jgi:O-antigen ligase
MAEVVVALSVVVVVALLVHRLGWRSVTVWIVLTGPVYPFLRFPSAHPVATFDRVWIGAIILALAVSARHGARRPSRALAGALFILVLATGLRALLTDSPDDPHHTYVPLLWLDAFVLPFGLFLAARRYMTTKDRVVALAKTLTSAGAILSAIAAAEQLIGFELATRSGGPLQVSLGPASPARITGPFTYPEVLATVLLVCIAATVFLLQLRPRGWATIAWICLVGELGALGLTLFRTAWIAVLVVLVVAVGLRPGRPVRVLALGLLVTAFAVAALGPLQKSSVINERINNTTNVYARLSTYVDGLHIFLKHPVFGVGVTNFSSAEADLGPSAAAVNGVQGAGTAHDSFINIGTEDGLSGLFPLVLVVGTVWHVFRRYRRESSDRLDILFAAAAIGAALGYLLMSVTETMILEGIPNAFFALLLGAVAGRLDGVVSTEAGWHDEFGASAEPEAVLAAREL